MLQLITGLTSSAEHSGFGVDVGISVGVSVTVSTGVAVAVGMEVEVQTGTFVAVAVGATVSYMVGRAVGVLDGTGLAVASLVGVKTGEGEGAARSRVVCASTLARLPATSNASTRKLFKPVTRVAS